MAKAGVEEKQARGGVSSTTAEPVPSRLDDSCILRHYFTVKTISSEQAVRQFDEYSKLAHNGEKILVTLGGKPWVMLSSPLPSAGDEPAAGVKREWPDFAARLSNHYTTETTGPTAAELLAQDKADRF